MDSESEAVRNSSEQFSDEFRDEEARDEPLENSQDKFQSASETEEQLDEVNDLPEGAAAKKMVELARAIYDSTPSIDKGKLDFANVHREQKDVQDLGQRKKGDR